MKIFRYLFCFTLVAGSLVAATKQPLTLSGLIQKQWTLVVYMVPDRTLDEWAVRNIKAMVTAQASDDVAILVQLLNEGNTAERFWVKDNQRVDVEAAQLSLDMGQDLTAAVAYAAVQAPAQKYGVFCWGHGYGALNPSFDTELKEWDLEPDMDVQCSNGFCPLKSFDPEHQTHRGVMVHALSNTMLKTTDIEAAFASIHQSLGQKVEFVGFDACKMAMREVADHLKAHAHYLVGSQNCELADGWDYNGLLTALAANPTASTEEFINNGIMSSYKSYYVEQTKKNTYTLSAIKLSAIDNVNESLAGLVGSLEQVTDKAAVQQVLVAARAAGVNMCTTPAFTDLGVLTDRLAEEIGVNSAMTAEERSVVIDQCAAVKSALTQAVFANVTGEVVSMMQGMSVYFPFKHIDSSYRGNTRAYQSPWMRVLKLYGLEV